ncbi:MAG: glycerate kinase [Desulfurococcales archaeon]|nr:glycerate kinase [Desulfurococcales archaeon]
MAKQSSQEELRGTLRKLVKAVIEFSRLDEHVKGELELAGFCGSKAIVLGLGKGSIQMARGALSCVEPVGGVVVTTRGSEARLPGVEVLGASHPVPDDSSVKAAEALLEWAGSAGKDDLVIALVSGGGSALAEKPIPPLTLDDVRETVKLLLASGASIHEMNTVRKHLSEVKGGRLAARAYPARLLGLYASDVPGDKLDVIASGPTVPDPTTYSDALTVLRRYGLYDRVPDRVVELLERGARGEVEETPKPGDPRLSRTSNRLVAANIDVLRALSRYIYESLEFNTIILTSRLEGESREVGKALASITLEALDRGVPVKPPAAILAGGETTVRVRGPGVGGRNLELATSWALAVAYWEPNAPAAMLAMDTDGIDGSSPAAGAIVTPSMVEEARSMGLSFHEALERNDTYTLLKKLGATVETGPTGTNLNSVSVILVSP